MFLINPYIYRTDAWTNLKSISFDGVDEYLTGSTITELSNVGAFSISFWATRPTIATNTIWFNQTTSSTNAVQILHRGGTPYFIGSVAFAVKNGSLDSNITNLVMTSGWNHIVCVYDGSLTNLDKGKIYVNGSLATLSRNLMSATTSPTFTTETFDVGGDGISNYTASKMDEVRIYDYALTSGNVTSIYNSGVPKEDDLSTLAVHNYRMGDNDTYPTISDVGTGTATDLTMTNMESGDIGTDVP